MIRLVIFDHSGVLVNDLEITWRAISRILDHYGKKADTLEEFRKKIKHPYWNYFVEKGLSLEDAKSKTIPEMYTDLYTEWIDQIALFDDVKNIILSLKEMSIKMAIVSQLPRKLIDGVIKRHDLMSYFDPILGLHDYEEPKPSPSSLQKALRLSGMDPANAIYVGDMQEDIIAAKRAGVLPVGI